MCRSQQVIDCLDRVECRSRNFYKYCVPVAHGTVPQTGKFERTEFAAAKRFLGNKTGCGVYVFTQVVAGAVGMLEIAYKVNGIEIACAFHHLGILRLGEIYLRRFENLRGNRLAVRRPGVVRTAAGFAFVAYHTANAQGTVENIEKRITAGCYVDGRFEVLAAHKQYLLYKFGGIGYYFFGRLSGKRCGKSFDTVAYQKQETADEFLIAYSVGTVCVAYHVVDIFDEYYRSIDIGKIFDQCSMTTGTEHEFALVVAEEFVVGCDCNCICARFLLRKADFVAYTVAFFHSGHSLGKFCLEEFTVVRRYCEMQFYHSVFRRRCLCAFGKLFFESGAYTVVVAVEG